MTTGFIDGGRRDERAGPPPTSRIVNVLLLWCSAIALFLAVQGGGVVSNGMLKASFWALVAGLAAIVIILLWRAARLLRMIHQ